MGSKGEDVSKDPNYDEQPPPYRPPSPAPTYRTVDSRAPERSTRPRIGITGRLRTVFSSRSPRPAPLPPPALESPSQPAPGPAVPEGEDKGPKAATISRDTSVASAIEKNEENEEKLFQILLGKEFDVNTCLEDGSRLLHVAAGLGRTSVVEALIEANAEIVVQNKEGDTPLHLALKGTHERVVEILIVAEENVTYRAKLLSSLELAAEAGDEDMVRRFLREFQRPDRPYYPFCPDLWMRLGCQHAAKKGHRSIVAFLHGERPESPDTFTACYELKILRSAIHQGWPEIVAQALGRCIRNDFLTHGTNRGLTERGLIIMAATRAGNVDIIEQLLRAGLTTTDCIQALNISPLRVAAREGQTDVVRAFLDGGSDVNERGSSNYSALFEAIGRASSAATIRLLVERGADFHAVEGGIRLCRRAKLFKCDGLDDLFSGCNDHS